MKFLCILATILVIAATAAAQTPFYPYPYYSPYGSTYGYPYYSSYGYPYSPGFMNPNISNQVVPYYLQPNYVSPYQPERANSDQVINDLSNQVERLTDEVERLQTDSAAPAPQPPSAYATSEGPTAPAKTVALIFNNGTRIESQGYAIAGDTLWIWSPSGLMTVPLIGLNLEATRKENAERGIDFPITQ